MKRSNISPLALVTTDKPLAEGEVRLHLDAKSLEETPHVTVESPAGLKAHCEKRRKQTASPFRRIGAKRIALPPAPSIPPPVPEVRKEMDALSLPGASPKPLILCFANRSLPAIPGQIPRPENVLPLGDALPLEMSAHSRLVFPANPSSPRSSVTEREVQDLPLSPRG